MERLWQLRGLHYDLRVEGQKGHASHSESAFYPGPDMAIELQPSVLHKFSDFPTGDDANAEYAIDTTFEKIAMLSTPFHKFADVFCCNRSLMVAALNEAACRAATVRERLQFGLRNTQLYLRTGVLSLQAIRSSNPPNPNVGVENDHFRASQSSLATGSNGSRNSRTESRRLPPTAAADAAALETTNTSTGWPGSKGSPSRTSSPCSPTVVSRQCACTASL